ncbi:MAG: Glycosyltransferase [Candidatus Amesbacteria bacterium GW2011_GWA1_47_16]|uniref:PMT family glycosyltransferase, 4-amino-4-deoxy-L-arabinose transferase n=5 Tax=Candidatus Amesiibacteriota TaxID=1752730 RepID=A0A0G1V436_9BACT|nr:MAG: PMT family glycosyltransferase, 4-amino-4-deoxy-L-arabinose transferase [Candidatus Amesbacteria bacterium GW2011_GWC1_47_15]KKU64767.1 MAG: Glycosyltransferase [Candidatus Amesbacteria bacterium GW2011_GWA1_47_16]KKU98354.1 MAG: Glycosyltransferase [Candidatus Amesbacteria bacterium GW2011_GWB1_48_13]OGC99648.1 MAG: hypothetical protein A2972_04530 [Candidatus Amesbacteria bacterium RIFCSPLOWO2_01_FULL_47_33]OGD00446.1 MAG: hypothetical protein A2701_03680 [Candidatus Amesbacteria bact
MKSPSLSVVIPAYNEEANIAACLTNVSSVLKKLKLDSEIILVDDGSKDRTGEIAKSFINKIPGLKVVVNHPNRGYGGSLRAGFDAATGEFIAFVPADNQFDFAEITRLLNKQAETNADIVSGIRADRHDPLMRKITGWGWNSIVRALFGYLASDIDCGFKMFRREILDHVHLMAERGAMIDTQLFASARARGYSVAEIPLTHLHRTAGKSTGNNPRVIIQSFVDLLSFWWRLRREILVEKGRAVFKWELFIFLFILLLAAFFRLWRIDEYMTFLGDEGRDMIAMRDIVTARHFPLIGPGTSVGSMYLGPLYYYLVAPSVYVSGFSPVGPAVFVALIGLLTIGLVWWIGRQWFGRELGLAMTALYAFSPAVITYSRSSWNPNVMPFFALITMYAVWKVWRWGYWRWLLVAALAFAFVLNSHYLGLLLLPPILIFVLLRFRQERNWRYLLFSLFLFLLLMSPLLFFDLRHGWTNYIAMKTFFTDRQTTVNVKFYKSLPYIWPIWKDINTSLLAAGQKLPGTVISIFTPLALLYLILKLRLRLLNPDLLFVSVWTVSGLVGLGLYKQHIYIHYYGFLFPVPFFLLGYALYFFPVNKILKNFLAIFSFLMLLVPSLLHHPFTIGPNDQLHRSSLVADTIIREVGGRPFNLALISRYNYDASYRYLLSLKSAPYYTVHEKLTDQLFVICESAAEPEGCQPIGHPLWEIASFGWAKIDSQWDFSWGVKLYRLVNNPSGQ